MAKKRLLLLNGSPRRRGTSFSFARTLKMLTEEFGHSAEILHVMDYFDGQEDLAQLKRALAGSDIAALVAPVYVDTLPYPDIWLFEQLRSAEEVRGKAFFAIGQSGFPDITVCQPLLGSCRCFAEAAGMKWRGGLAYGGGAILDGAYLEDLGKKGQKITSAFELALEDVLAGRNISAQAQELLTIRIPRWLYRPLAAFLNYQARKTARRHGVTDIARRFYLE